MGKNKHSKDRMFITATEWKQEYGGKKTKTSSGVRTLPFNCCALSMSEFENPVCTREGVIFDVENIMPFLEEHKLNPVTGEPMTASDLIQLHMAKNTDGAWHCPVTFKVFNSNTHIVAIRTSGNVYAYEAVNELNLKPKNFTDLLTGESFTRSDIITLFNPDNPDIIALRDINNFKHHQLLRNSKSATSAIRHNPTAEKILSEASKRTSISLTDMLRKANKDTSDVDTILQLQPAVNVVIPGKLMTNQKASSSLTSSAVDAHTDATIRLATAEEIREARWRKMRELGKKGYVQLQTSMGNINLEIHCDWTPRTAWNFLTLCSRNYYDNTIFHRLIPRFMLQGGDPTGTGCGGASAWGEAFKDEFDSRLKHDSRGQLSMANSGPNTNGSQFFITFAKAEHLDLVHTVFGRVVGGSAVLDEIERIGCDKKEAPLREIKLLHVEVFSNPITEADELLVQDITNAMATRYANKVIAANVRSSPVIVAEPKQEKKVAAEVKQLKAVVGNEAAVAAFMKAHRGDEASDDSKNKKRKLDSFANW